MNPVANFLPALLTFIAFLMVVSFVYDLGQMLAARWFGVRPRWRFGYVALPGALQAKPLMARAAITAAGLIANLLLAILLLAATYSQSGVSM